VALWKKLLFAILTLAGGKILFINFGVIEAGHWTAIEP